MIPRRIGTEKTQLNRLLAALPPAELSALTPFLREVSLCRGTVLHEPGDLIAEVYFPHDAVISMVGIMQNGASVETAMIGHEAALGLGAALTSRRAVTRAVVQLPGRAARMGAAEFNQAALASAVLRELAGRANDLLIAQLQQSVACNALHSAEARLCRRLLEYSDRADGELALTQDALAQAISVRRTTVTIIAQILQDAGAIRYRRGVIQVLDRALLEKSSCECYQSLRRQADDLHLHCAAWSEPKSA
jgi:CRP-like cAMP-binding protein